jgi:hypothetical protein
MYDASSDVTVPTVCYVFLSTSVCTTATLRRWAHDNNTDYGIKQFVDIPDYSVEQVDNAFKFLVEKGNKYKPLFDELKALAAQVRHPKKIVVGESQWLYFVIVPAYVPASPTFARLCGVVQLCRPTCGLSAHPPGLRREHARPSILKHRQKFSNCETVTRNTTPNTCVVRSCMHRSRSPRRPS